MPIRRYGQLGRSVLRGANAAPYVRSVRRKPPREADWTRLDPGSTAAPKAVASEPGYVIAISLTIETPPGPK